MADILSVSLFSQMDFPVEVSVHLNIFQDEREVVEILRSHGFTLKDRRTNEVRVQGLFSKLRSVKAHLEQLLKAQNQNSVSSSCHSVSSGAIPKNYCNNRSRNKPTHASASSPNTSASLVSDTSYNHPTSPQYRAASSLRPDQRGSVRRRRESFVVEEDVFKYADQLRREDINRILMIHQVRMRVDEADESFQITLEGTNVRAAAGELQSFLNDLTRSLRTQEVPLKDMGPKGEVVLQRIREKRNIHDSVLVREMNDRLHLIGPSGKSYELKQRLLEKSAGQSGRTGRTFDRNSMKRSSSLPAVGRKITDRDSGAVAKTSPVRAADHFPSEPVGAAGYSPSKYKDDKQGDAEPEWGASRRRTQSETRENKRIKSRNGYLQQETENKQQSKSPAVRKPLLSNLLDPKNIKKVFKGKFKKYK